MCYKRECAHTFENLNDLKRPLNGFEDAKLHCIAAFGPYRITQPALIAQFSFESKNDIQVIIQKLNVYLHEYSGPPV